MNVEVKEVILGVAFKLFDPKSKEDQILSDPFPTTHVGFLNKLATDKKFGLHAMDGFYSNLRKFLTREEALCVADESAQLVNPSIHNTRLYSKNVINSKEAELST